MHQVVQAHVAESFCPQVLEHCSLAPSRPFTFALVPFAPPALLYLATCKPDHRRATCRRVAVPRPVSRRVQASASKEQEPKSNATDDVEKYGLEAGLFKVQ